MFVTNIVKCFEKFATVFTPELLMTLTASTNLLMSHVHRRWMTHLEQLTVQGFPVTTHHTHGHACSSFALRWAQQYQGFHSNPWPSRNAMRQQSGNSMHVTCSGVILLFMFTQTVFDENLLSLHKFRIQRALALQKPIQLGQPTRPLPGSGSSSGAKRHRII